MWDYTPGKASSPVFVYDLLLVEFDEHSSAWGVQIGLPAVKACPNELLEARVQSFGCSRQIVMALRYGVSGHTVVASMYYFDCNHCSPSHIKVDRNVKRR